MFLINFKNVNRDQYEANRKKKQKQNTNEQKKQLPKDVCRGLCRLSNLGSEA